jgi:hypothetical protein
VGRKRRSIHILELIVVHVKVIFAIIEIAISGSLTIYIKSKATIINTLIFIMAIFTFSLLEVNILF